jgi:hypothetical protein
MLSASFSTGHVYETAFSETFHLCYQAETYEEDLSPLSTIESIFHNSISDKRTN